MGYSALAWSPMKANKHLAFNVYLVTLLAFVLHQVSKLCDIAFQACRKKAGSKELSINN